MSRHPGWNGVGQYDAALRGLTEAGQRLPSPGHADETLATLPPLSPAAEPLNNFAPSDLAQSDRRLLAVQQSLLSALSQRRERERREELRQEGELRAREALRLFTISAGKDVPPPDLDLQLLQASVTALTNTVNNWKLSAPPAPQLAALREKVIQDRARLDALLAERTQGRDAAAAQRRDEVQNVRDTRAAYVKAELDALEARLVASDDTLLVVRTAQLTRQRTDLRTALSRPAPLAVSEMGDAGRIALPHGPGIISANLSQASLAASEIRLREQRTRWLQFLRDDTRSAALDTAQEKRWEITFGPPRPGERDLTAAMAQALESGVWRM